MPTHHELIAFDRPLIGVVAPGCPARQFTEGEVAAIRAEAYRQGGDAERAFSGEQMVELRAGVQALQSGVLQKLADCEAQVVSQVRTALPALALELARRLLAGSEPSAERLEALCREALDQLYPEREQLELVLGPRDAELLAQLAPGWMNQYPQLRVSIDPAFAPGDCQVRSRFGLIDATASAKLAALARELTPAAAS